jgi:hypothetical protein
MCFDGGACQDAIRLMEGGGKPALGWEGGVRDAWQEPGSPPSASVRTLLPA